MAAVASIKDFLSSFLLIELFKGLKITGRHFFARNITVQFPQENDELDKTYEGSREAGIVAAEEESDTDALDGSNANNLRTK